MSARVCALLAVVSGSLAALTFPSPGLWPLAFVAWAPLLVALREVRPRRGAALGFAAGVVYFAIALRWLAPLSVWGWLALAAALAGYSALFGAAAALLISAAEREQRAAHRLAFRAAVPATWVALEWIRSWALTGFGWAAAGYALAPATVLIQSAALGGVFLLSLGVLTSNQALAVAWPAVRARRWRTAAAPLAVAAAAPVLLAVYGAVSLGLEPTAPRQLRVAAIQGDIPPHEKWKAGGMRLAMSRYVPLTTRAIEQSPELVVWPETAVPVPLDEVTGAFSAASDLRRRVDHIWRTPLLWGTPERTETKGKLWNAAVLYHPDGAHRPTYRKRKLVPFAEYHPAPSALGFIPRVLSGPEIVPGDGGAPFDVDGVRVGVLICFEDVFSDEAILRARDAELLAIITNDAWFTASGREQHLDIAILRAVETRRSIARAANNGVTALIDARGRVLARAPAGQSFAVGALPVAAGETLFAAMPDLLPLALLLIALAMSAIALAGRSRRSVRGADDE